MKSAWLVAAAMLLGTPAIANGVASKGDGDKSTSTRGSVTEATTKQQARSYADRVRVELDELERGLDRMAQSAKQETKAVRADVNDAIKEIRQDAKQARTLLNKTERAVGESWLQAHDALEDKIDEINRGFANAASRLGPDAVFIVMVPAAEERARAAERVPPQPAAPVATVTIVDVNAAPIGSYGRHAIEKLADLERVLDTLERRSVDSPAGVKESVEDTAEEVREKIGDTYGRIMAMQREQDAGQWLELHEDVEGAIRDMTLDVFDAARDVERGQTS